MKEKAISTLGCNNNACILSYFDADCQQLINKKLNNKNVELLAEVMLKNENINNLKTQIEKQNKKENEVNNLKEKLKLTEKNYKSLMVEHTNLSINYTKCQDEFKQLEISFEKNKEKNESMEKKLNEYLFELKNKLLEISKLNKASEELNNTIENFKKENCNKKLEVDILETEIKKYRIKNNELKKKLNDISGNSSSLQVSLILSNLGTCVL
jgi:chromosome segregation ATPase